MRSSHRPEPMRSCSCCALLVRAARIPSGKKITQTLSVPLDNCISRVSLHSPCHRLGRARSHSSLPPRPRCSVAADAHVEQRPTATLLHARHLRVRLHRRYDRLDAASVCCALLACDSCSVGARAHAAHRHAATQLHNRHLRVACIAATTASSAPASAAGCLFCASLHRLANRLQTGSATRLTDPCARSAAAAAATPIARTSASLGGAAAGT